MENITEKTLPVVAIVGRPNVGKSSLFNALIGSRLSIVHEMPGVTRDRVMAPTSYRNRRFQLIDTGGLALRYGETRNRDMWDERISQQVESALTDADVLVFVTNVQDGVMPLDEEVAQKLREHGKTVLLVANKSDNPTLVQQAVEMTQFGFKRVFPVSCLHRSGIGDLLDEIVDSLPAEEVLPETEDAENAASPSVENEPVRIAILGRPNVGKSSLVNALLGEDRVMVSDVAGTTRDAIDVDFAIQYRGEERPAVLIDTAGLRKKAKVSDAVEMFSVMRAQTALSRARIVLFVTEASIDGVTAQDRRIAGMIEESGKACVLVVNKVDTCSEHPSAEIVKQIRYTLPGLSYAPLVLVSAEKRRNLSLLLDQISQVMELLNVRIPTSVVNQVISDAFEKVSPPVIGYAPLKLYYSSQVATEPPKFLLFVNDKKYCADNYLAYLRNALRSAFDFTGLPIVLELRSRPKKVESVHTPSRSTPGRPARKSGSKPKPAAKPKKKSGTSRVGGPNSKKRAGTGKGRPKR